MYSSGLSSIEMMMLMLCKIIQVFQIRNSQTMIYLDIKPDNPDPSGVEFSIFLVIQANLHLPDVKFSVFFQNIYYIYNIEI